MIDWRQVTELRDDMGDGFDEVVEVFLLEVEEAMSRLAPESGDESLASELHFLKGAALNLGFRDFAALCADGETRSAAGNGAGVDLAAIRAVYAASREAFIAGLKRDAA